MNKPAIIVVAAATLSGCVSPSSVGRAMSYPATSTNVSMPDDTYRVFEHKTEKSIMTTPSLAKAMGPSTVAGLTLGVVEKREPIEGHRAAARQYLDMTGRADCEIVSSSLVMNPQFEFAFRCP